MRWPAADYNSRSIQHRLGNAKGLVATRPAATPCPTSPLGHDQSHLVHDPRENWAPMHPRNRSAALGVILEAASPVQTTEGGPQDHDSILD
jgi:hypothetical protein